jgi:membrane-associated phospholipid phosphatase
MRSSALIAFILAVSCPRLALAQDPPAQPPPSLASQQDPQKPPAVVGEEPTKPTRNFGSALVHNLGDDFKHLPRWNTVYFLAGGGGLAAAVHPADDNINKHFAGSGAESFFLPGKYIGNTVVILGAGLTSYLIGRTTKKPRLEHLGMDEIEGQIIADILVIGIKESVRRERPIRSDGTRASGFSFPSGHAASTFAGATILQQHLGYKAGIPTYLIASYVALSRLHENVHFLSDVVFGAAVGTVVGRTVTWHGRNFYASPMLLPGGTGIVVTVHAAAPVSHH